jgi:hypothetical protein
LKTFFINSLSSVTVITLSFMTSSNTPMSPIRDFKGDATVDIVSTPAFLSTPSDMTPARLFSTPSVELISPSSLRFSTPHYKQHFSSFLEPTPSAPLPVPMNNINIVNEFRWMTPSVEVLTSSTLSSLSSDDDSDSAHSNSATGSLSDSSESLQFKWSETP